MVAVVAVVCDAGTPLSTVTTGTGGVSVTSAVTPIAEPASCPVMCATPLVPVAVSVAEYVPSPLSPTELSDPRVVATATVELPVERSLPYASFARTVIADVPDVPSALIEDGLTEITEWAASAEPGLKVTVAVAPIGAASSVPVTVAGPAEVEVRLALYVPSPLSVPGPRVTRLGERGTVA